MIFQLIAGYPQLAMLVISSQKHLSKLCLFLSLSLVSVRSVSMDFFIITIDFIG